jgi:hypothetical protein
MSLFKHFCLGCGHPVSSVFGTILHCDPVEPIDDITDTDEPLALSQQGA